MFYVGSHSAAMTQCTVAWDSVSVSANRHLTVYHARQKSVAGYQGWQAFFFIYKKNVPRCMNSQVFTGRFGFMALDGFCNLFLTLKNESEGFRSIHLTLDDQKKIISLYFFNTYHVK